jgi:hypothetical protein
MLIPYIVGHDTNDKLCCIHVYRLAKSTFARTKDAMDVCLYYIALGKTNVLGALAKLSKSDQCKVLLEKEHVCAIYFTDILTRMLSRNCRNWRCS